MRNEIVARVDDVDYSHGVIYGTRVDEFEEFEEFEASWTGFIDLQPGDRCSFNIIGDEYYLLNEEKRNE